jgi:hypothetical protein
MTTGELLALATEVGYLLALATGMGELLALATGMGELLALATGVDVLLALARSGSTSVCFNDLFAGTGQHHLNKLLEVDPAVLVPVSFREHQRELPEE